MREEPQSMTWVLASEDRESHALVIAWITPVIRARATRVVLRCQRQQAKLVEYDVDEITQEVLALLFANQARVLRRWNPERGMSLRNYVGLVAERAAGRLLRQRRRRPSEAGSLPLDWDIPDPAPGPEATLAARELAALALDAIRRELTPRGCELFDLLLVEDCSVEEVCDQLGLSRDATYAWRSRLGKVARRVGTELERGRVTPSMSALVTPFGDSVGP